jgi:hypothetical protein
MLQGLLCNYEALSSNPSPTQKISEKTNLSQNMEYLKENLRNHVRICELFLRSEFLSKQGISTVELQEK